ncbi:MAG TPA: hypothetical protein VEK57_04555 [Thermoanaerobaculia bacterium]|jgi:hypothetical protein|nr:hypothetical protein [Thermoanaerobaculia bacterium]
MSAEEVREELEDRGINPEPVVDRVVLFVRNRVTDWVNRGLLHLGRTLLNRLFHQLTAWPAAATWPLRQARELRH